MLSSLPMAVVIALSPFAIIPAIVLLLTPRPRAAAGAFLGGWALGVGLVTGAAVVAADLVDAYGTSPRWVEWTRLVLGAALVVLGALRWRGRDAGGTPPAWLSGVKSATPRRALALGLTLSVANPKVLLLAVAGGIAIGAGAAGVAREVLGVVLFTAVSSLGVALPWFAFLAAPGPAMRMLERLRRWLEANADAVMAVVLMALGLALLAKGVGGP